MICFSSRLLWNNKMIWSIITIRFCLKSIHNNSDFTQPRSVITFCCLVFLCKALQLAESSISLLNIKSHLISSCPRQATGSWKNILLKTLISFVVKRLMRFVFPWWPPPHSIRDNNESSQRPQGHQNSARPQRFNYCGTSYTTWRSPCECFLLPSSQGFWDRQRLGLLAKGWHMEWQNSCVCLSGLVFIRLTFAGSGSSRLWRSQG